MKFFKTFLQVKIFLLLNNRKSQIPHVNACKGSCRNWQVKFNPEKCEAMRISHKQDKSKHQYYLSDARLKCVDSYKDLGVIMSRDLSWSNHVNASVNKANKVLGLLKRTVGSKNREIF